MSAVLFPDIAEMHNRAGLLGLETWYWSRDQNLRSLVWVSGVRSRSLANCVGLVTYGLMSRGLSRPFLNLQQFKMTLFLTLDHSYLIHNITLLITYNFEIKP